MGIGFAKPIVIMARAGFWNPDCVLGKRRKGVRGCTRLIHGTMKE